MQPLQMPLTEREAHEWTVGDDWYGPRRERASASGIYHSAIPARIHGLELTMPADLVADMEEAATALATFDQYAKNELGITSPSLGPMSSVLLRTESASSSQIENITVGARQLALAAIEQSTSENANLVDANVRSMEAAIELSESLTPSAILEIHRVLMEGQESRIAPGQWRRELVWVGTSTLTPIGASYVAPQAEHVPAAIDDLVAFIDRDDIPVIAQMAIAHAQFETIHPFPDGNGRAGRALVHAITRAKGISRNTTAPISAGLLRDTDAYFNALTEYRTGNARPIVESFCNASRFAAYSGTHLIDQMSGHLRDAQHRLDALGLRSDATARKILPLLASYPIVDARILKATLGLNDVTVQRALASLVDAGVLVERSGKKRNRVYHQPDILATLDDFAAALIRR